MGGGPINTDYELLFTEFYSTIVVSCRFEFELYFQYMGLEEFGGGVAE